MSGFVRSSTARSTGDAHRVIPSVDGKRPYIVVAGPENLSEAELQNICSGLENRRARTAGFRMTEAFRIDQFRAALAGCDWLLIALEEHPGRELELLRVAERELVPKVGVICLSRRIQTSGSNHIGGQLDLVVRRSYGDMSFDFTRSNHTLVVINLQSESGAKDIARAIIPVLPD